MPTFFALAQEPVREPIQMAALYTPAVVLPAEPVHEPVREPIARVALTAAPTTPARALEALREAIDQNDFYAFHAALDRAGVLADSMPLGSARNALRRNVLIYRDIDQLWTFARTDRFGAFFDDESLPGMRDHLAADYPGWESFVAGSRIVDAHGVELYPTAESRTFLMRQLDSVPRDTPRSLTASSSSPRRAHRAATHTATKSATRRVAAKQAAKPPMKAARAIPRRVAPATEAIAPKVTTSVAAAPPIVAAKPTPIVPAAPAPAQTPAVPAQAPAQDAFAPPPNYALPAKREEHGVPVDGSTVGRGVFLIVLGLLLLGGLIALMRAPQAPPSIVTRADADKKKQKGEGPTRIRKAQ